MLTFGIQSGVALRLPPLSKHRLSRYGPLILWPAFIFIGSTDLLSAANTGGVLVRPVLCLFPHASGRTVAVYQFVTRQTGHLTEYVMFALQCVPGLGASCHELRH